MIEEFLNDPSWAGEFDEVCHDLNQSIAAGLLLSNVDGDHQPPEQASHRLSAVHEQLEYAAALLAKLTDQQPVADEWADLADVASQCVAAHSATAPIALRIDGSRHRVRIDRVMVHRAVANLLDNAARATGGAGHVSVEVGRTEDESWIEVSDDGPGFGRIRPGTGHGLEIIQGAIWAGSGRLQIETGPGTGTAVRMSFPAAEVNR